MIFYLATMGSFLYYSKSKYFLLKDLTGLAKVSVWASSLAFLASFLLALAAYGSVNGSLLFLCLILLSLGAVQVVSHLPWKYRCLCVGLLHIFLVLSLLY